MQDSDNIKNFTASDIESYWKGKLSMEEMRAMEKTALDDPFLADAMEGYRISGTEAGDIDIIRKKLEERTSLSPGGSGSITVPGTGWWKLAAGIAGLAGIGFITVKLFTGNNDSSIAVNEKQKTIQQFQAVQAEDSAIVINTDNVNSGNSKVEKLRGNNRAENTDTVIMSPGLTHSESRNTLSLPVEEKQAIIKEPETGKAKSAEALPVNTEKTDIINKSYRTDSVVLSGKAPGVVTSFPEQEKKLNNSVDGFALENKNSKLKGKTIYYPGRVTDAYNNTIPYANVMNFSNQSVVQTSVDGFFKIPIESDSLVLLDVSAPGYANREFRLNRFDRTNSTLVLYEENDDTDPGKISLSAELYDTEYIKSENPDLMPEPENGWLIFNQHLLSALTENNEAFRAGTVILSFNINATGRPNMIRVIKSLSPVCDAEAIKLLKTGPRWISKGRNKNIHLMFRFH